MSDAQELIKVLHQRLGYETVKPTVSANQIRLAGRVGTAHMRNWVVAAAHLLQVAEGATWSLDLSKHYFLRAGQMVYTWRLIFQAENVAQHLPSIIGAINNSPRARFEVEEQALPGVNGPRTMMNKRGKGAASAGSTPMLIRQRAGG
jgi:hypothetical protein